MGHHGNLPVANKLTYKFKLQTLSEFSCLSNHRFFAGGGGTASNILYGGPVFLPVVAARPAIYCMWFLVAYHSTAVVTAVVGLLDKLKSSLHSQWLLV